MRRASVFTALILSVFAVQSASAAVIGVRGGDPGSEPATNGGAFALSACSLTGEDAFQYYCAEYYNDTGQDLYAVDLAYWDEYGNPMLASGLDGESFFSNFEKAPESDFQLIRFFPENDPYLVRLCTDEVGAGVEACQGEFGFDPLIPAGYYFVVFADFQGFVSIQGWNEGANDNLAPRGEQIPVPEPATLLLMGLGVAAAAGRRLRSRRN